MEELNIYSKNSIVRYYTSRKLQIKKQFGQNFLINVEIGKKIIKASNVQDEQIFIEIGPGLGNLTKLLCEHPTVKKIYAVEKDKDFLEPLEFIKKDFASKLELHFIDFKRFNLDGLDPNIKVIGNLPYNCASYFVNRFIDLEKFFSMTFTMQLEVANRICAKVSSKDYGYLSVVSQCFFDCIKHFDISADNFFPKPQVCSSVISMTPYSQPININIYKSLKKILNCVFSKRRKMLSVSLKSLISNPVDYLNKVSLNPSLRPQDVCVEKYIELAKLIEGII